MPANTWIAALIICLLCSSGQAQQYLWQRDTVHLSTSKEKYITTIIGAKDGLPSSEILTLVQDEYGFVWIGTSFGLSRYDGLTFTNFLTCGNRQLGKTFTLMCDTVLHIVWIMSDAGLCFYNNGKLQQITIHEKDIAVYDMCIDSSKGYWLATSHGPAYITPAVISHIVQSGNINMEAYILPGWKTFANNRESVKKIAAANNGKLYFSTSSTLYCFDQKSISRLWQMNSPVDKITSIIPHSNNRLYFSSILTGLHDYYKNTISSFSAKAPISANIFSRNNNLYYLNSNGIYRVDTASNSLQLISTIPGGENKWLSRLMVDREDNLWIGMHHTLIFQQKKLFHIYDNVQAPEGTEFFSICKTKNNDILFGGDKGKIYQLKGSVIQLREKLPNIHSEIKAIATDSRGWMWYVSGVDGIVIAKNTGIQHIKTIEGQPLEGYSFLLEDDDGNMWSGGDGVLTKINIDKFNYAVTCKNYYSRLPGDNWFTFLGAVKGSRNKYWFAGAQGLFTFSNDSLQPYWPDNTTFRSNITSIQKDHNDEIWLATKGEGVWHCFFDEQGNMKVKRKLGIQEGLNTNIYTGLLCDKYNNIWAISYSGISMIRQKNASYFITNYNSRHGFIDKNYHNTTLFSQNDHTIWIVTSSALAWFNPADFDSPVNAPTLVLNSIQSGDSIYFGYNAQAPIAFPYNKNNLSFNFSGIHFNNPQAVKYFYRLSGNDTGWTNGGNEKNIHFQRLAPGKYILQVKAMLDSDNASPVITIAFTINQPFWFTWWFISVCTLSAAVLIWYIASRRIASIRKKEDEKNAIKKQIAELETKALKSQMNPHFVFNSLNSIAHLVASRQNEKGIEYLTKFSKLLRIILDESENNFVALKDEIKMLNLYLQIEAMRFGDTFSYNIHLDNSIDEDDMSVPALLLHPLVENAVWHGLLHKQGERRLIIYLKRINNDILQCTIKDNGIGIEAAKAMKEKRLNGIAQKSKGLQLVKDRLKMLEQQFGKPTFFSIEDIRSDNFSISGTITIIQFPVLYET
ncbi:MAG: histidine kinase [Chitinophagaceae bacterium]|nr:histidine kinase [Chitinophagaceae bacterium]